MLAPPDSGGEERWRAAGRASPAARPLNCPTVTLDDRNQSPIAFHLARLHPALPRPAAGRATRQPGRGPATVNWRRSTTYRRRPEPLLRVMRRIPWPFQPNNYIMRTCRRGPTLRLAGGSSTMRLIGLRIIPILTFCGPLATACQSFDVRATQDLERSYDKQLIWNIWAEDTSR